LVGTNGQELQYMTWVPIETIGAAAVLPCWFTSHQKIKQKNPGGNTVLYRGQLNYTSEK